MIQLRPTEYFPIVRVIGDTQDSTTYYVKAIIRNSDTGAIIDTVNLTDQGSRRFSKKWQVVADVGGEGFYVDITTTIYTDSGYTIEAGDYAEESETYLIQERYNTVFGNGSGGGVDIDYKKLRKIVQEEIKFIVIPEQEKVNLKIVEEGIKQAISGIENIKFPEQKETDLSGVIKEILNTQRAINDKPVTERTDLTPALVKNSQENKENLNQILSKLELLFKFVKEDLSNNNNSNNEIVTKGNKELIEKITSMFIDKTPAFKLVMPENKEEKEEEKPKKIRNFLRNNE